MPKEIITKNRGLTEEEIGKPFPKPAAPLAGPDPTDFKIVKLIDADPGVSIIENELGRFKLTGGSLAWRNNNPGNLKYGTFAASQGAIAKGQGDHAVFPTYKIGAKAHKVLVFSPDSRYYDKTLVDAMKIYAPASDGNDPKEYANYISKKAGINKTTIIGKLTPAQQDKMVAAMFAMEGYKVGKITKI